MESPTVYVLVTDNKFDFYNITEIGDKKYRILDRALKHVIVRRMFTIYQLAHFLIQELEKDITKYKFKLVVITGDFILSDLQIAKEVHVSFNNIGRIIKTYEKQQAALKEKTEGNSSHIKKNISKSTQAFELFRDGKKLTDVAIELEIPAQKAVKLWSQFLKLERMYDAYEFYKDFQYDIPRF